MPMNYMKPLLAKSSSKLFWAEEFSSSIPVIDWMQNEAAVLLWVKQDVCFPFRSPQAV